METKKSFFKSNSISAKVVIIGALVLLMLIPIGMIKSMIEEREGNKTAEQTEMGMKWGGRQQLLGPILVLPYVGSLVDSNPSLQYAYFLPDDYRVEGNLNPEERIRGIQKILSYQSVMHIDGKFAFPNYEKLNLKPSQIQWNKAFFILGITNLQGVKNKLTFNVNGVAQEVVAGIVNNDIVNSGVMVNFPIDLEKNQKEFKFDFDLTLNGTDGLNFIPIGKQSKIHMASTWKSVSYIGDYVPTEKLTEGNGIDAQWDVFDYNRNYTQMWVGNNPELKNSQLGLDLLLPIDHYQKTMRSVKYAIMFISLTFIVFFMVELLSKKRIHPIQYLLVSAALILFYSLLLALSEHVGFGISYLVSAIAIIALITTYSKSVFQDMKQTIFMGLFLTALYVFLYVVIQLEDMALLLGSIGLFIALSVVMFVSRKVNWYKEDNSELNQ